MNSITSALNHTICFSKEAGHNSHDSQNVFIMQALSRDNTIETSYIGPTSKYPQTFRS